MILDCKTRWNSTFLMLEAAEKYERAFKRLEKYDRDYRKKYIFEEVQNDALPSHDDLLVLASSMEEITFSSSLSSESDMEVDTDPKSKKKMKKKKKKKPRHHAPYAEDWSYARSLVKCLKVLFDATVRFSAATQVTTHTFLWEVVLIHEQLVQFRDNESDPFVRNMAEVMFVKYNKYWGAYEDMNSALFFAQLLDPREKAKGLEFVLECLYEKNQYMVDRVMKKVKEHMVRLFEEYKSSYEVVGESSTSGVGVSAVQAPVVVQEQSIEAMLYSMKKRHKRNQVGV
ncbi:uncharacterized protein LOC113348154 [Papaver somniferum]|uniref:uncharacterized protein LOC113348154 n=1 Tax=Papaver somniferum TaxID=3469 RepID=UPI000E6FB177|nr:uncharacterized protein LOC113348154 [Papaver somniferum]